MLRDKYKEPVPRPRKANNIDLTVESIHPEYVLKSEPSSVATDTGYLELFRIQPLRNAQPVFTGRWDWRANSIDIDLIGDPAAIKAFKADSSGYSGHHTVGITDSPKVFQVDIQTPTERIFKAKVSLSVELGLYLKDEVGPMIDEMTDQLRVLGECTYCGQVQFSGPPFALDVCPNCRRTLSAARRTSG